jgi:hypothetical protein
MRVTAMTGGYRVCAGWDSTIGLEETVVPPYTPVQVSGNRVQILGRSVRFNRFALPESITSNGHEILASPVQFVVETETGSPRWQTVRLRRVKQNEAVVEWESFAGSEEMVQRVRTRMEFDAVCCSP